MSHDAKGAFADSTCVQVSHCNSGTYLQFGFMHIVSMCALVSALCANAPGCHLICLPGFLLQWCKYRRSYQLIVFLALG